MALLGATGLAGAKEIGRGLVGGVEQTSQAAVAAVQGLKDASNFLHRTFPGERKKVFTAPVDVKEPKSQEVVRGEFLSAEKATAYCQKHQPGAIALPSSSHPHGFYCETDKAKIEKWARSWHNLLFSLSQSLRGLKQDLWEQSKLFDSLCDSKGCRLPTKKASLIVYTAVKILQQVLSHLESHINYCKVYPFETGYKGVSCQPEVLKQTINKHISEARTFAQKVTMILVFYETGKIKKELVPAKLSVMEKIWAKTKKVFHVIVKSGEWLARNIVEISIGAFILHRLLSQVRSAASSYYEESMGILKQIVAEDYYNLPQNTDLLDTVNDFLHVLCDLVSDANSWIFIAYTIRNARNVIFSGGLKKIWETNSIAFSPLALLQPLSHIVVMSSLDWACGWIKLLGSAYIGVYKFVTTAIWTKEVPTGVRIDQEVRVSRLEQDIHRLEQKAEAEAVTFDLGKVETTGQTGIFNFWPWRSKKDKRFVAITNQNALWKEMMRQLIREKDREAHDRIYPRKTTVIPEKPTLDTLQEELKQEKALLNYLYSEKAQRAGVANSTSIGLQENRVNYITQAYNSITTAKDIRERTGVVGGLIGFAESGAAEVMAKGLAVLVAVGLLSLVTQKVLSGDPLFSQDVKALDDLGPKIEKEYQEFMQGVRRQTTRPTLPSTFWESDSMRHLKEGLDQLVNTVLEEAA